MQQTLACNELMLFLKSKNTLTSSSCEVVNWSKITGFNRYSMLQVNDYQVVPVHAHLFLKRFQAGSIYGPVFCTVMNNFSK